LHRSYSIYNISREKIIERSITYKREEEAVWVFTFYERKPMKAIILKILSTTGCYLCTLAIKLAGHGYIEFRAYGIPQIVPCKRRNQND